MSHSILQRRTGNGQGVRPSGYRFERIGRPVQNGGIGKMHQADSRSIVKVRLVHVPDGAVASGATLTKVGATMAPDGMPEMTARVSALSRNDGTYRLWVHPTMAGNWAVQLAADIPGAKGPARHRHSLAHNVAACRATRGAAREDGRIPGRSNFLRST